MMEMRPKILSISQVVGYDGELAGVPIDQVCSTVYDIGQEFISEMMDTVYSDGPVYFKNFPFSEPNRLTVFISFGNKVSQTEEDTGLLLFKDKILVNSDDYASFSSDDLADYYNSLSVKYGEDNLDHLAVYHVLYHPKENTVVVDAYSCWEGN